MVILNKRYSSREICEKLQILAKEYSDIAVYREIGASYDRRPIGMVRIGMGKPTLILTGGIHGRESVNPVILLHMLERYLQCSQAEEKLDGYDICELLVHTSLCVIPLLNPDGYEIAQKGFGQIHNPMLAQVCRMKRIPADQWKMNARAVDINRNFPCQSYIPATVDDFPASEKETRALMRIFEEYHTVGYLDFHSRGKIIYYYRRAKSYSFNTKSARIARRLKRLSGYTLGAPADEGNKLGDGGNSVQYYAEQFDHPALTVETLPDQAEFPLDCSYQREAYEEIRLLPLELLGVLTGEKKENIRKDV